MPALRGVMVLALALAACRTSPLGARPHRDFGGSLFDLALTPPEDLAAADLATCPPGTFAAGATVESPVMDFYPQLLLPARFTGGGATDLLVTGYIGGPGGGPFGSALMLGSGDGALRVTDSAGPLGIFAGDGPALGDFTGDGNLDVLGSGSLGVRLLEGDGRGHLKAPRDITLPLGQVCFPQAAGDIDHDRNLDVAVLSVGDARVALALGQGGGAFTLAPPPSMPVDDVRQALLADVDEDGTLDLVAATSHALAVQIVDRQGGLGAARSFPTDPVRYPYGGVRAADFNRDGHLDFVVGSLGQKDGSLRVLLGDGHGAFTAGPLQIILPPLSLAAGDLDGDGAADLALVSGELGMGNHLGVLIGRGDGLFQPEQVLALPSEAVGVAIAPMDADCRPDLVVGLASKLISVVLNGTR